MPGDLTRNVVVGVLQALAVYLVIWVIAQALRDDRGPTRWHAVMTSSYTVAYHAGRLGMWAETHYREAIV